MLGEQSPWGFAGMAPSQSAGQESQVEADTDLNVEVAGLLMRLVQSNRTELVDSGSWERLAVVARHQKPAKARPGQDCAATVYVLRLPWSSQHQGLLPP